MISKYILSAYVVLAAVLFVSCDCYADIMGLPPACNR